MKRKELFDTYALNYDEVLNDSLSISGLTKDYFAYGRAEWLKSCLTKMNCRPRVMMDYGCGTGSAIPYIAELLNPEKIIGVDVSEASLAEARKVFSDSRIRIYQTMQYADVDAVDGVYCSCVFHHIPVPERLETFQYIHRSLKLGGVFSLWEHNPWNPATQYIVSQCAFDRDAVLLFPNPTRKMLAMVGFEVIATHYLFIFPASLRVLKPAEKYLSSLPIGAQYQILCRKK